MAHAIPRWKFWLSHLFDYHLESRESELNDTLHLILSKGRFQLYTENAIYSFEDLYDNFYNAFEQLNLDNLPDQAEVLILGYGMASIPLMLEKKFKRNYQYTGIELDEEIIDLAHHYISPRLSSKQEVICADAQIFMKTTEAQYDMIIVDLFIDNLIPPKFEQIAFLELVKKRLRPDGLVLYNRLANDKFSKEQSAEFFKYIFRPVFKKADKIVVDDNWIIVSEGGDIVEAKKSFH